MKFTYDADADAVFLYLVPSISAGQVAQSTAVPLAIKGASVIVSLDESGRALGIEVLGVSNLFSAEGVAAWENGRTPFDTL